MGARRARKEPNVTDLICLHCVEEFEWTGGDDWTCPACLAAGHKPGRNEDCGLCWVAYVAALDAIKARIDARVAWECLYRV
jgi:hypothetical protein